MWLGVSTVASLERCPIFRMSFLERLHCTVGCIEVKVQRSKDSMYVCMYVCMYLQVLLPLHTAVVLGNLRLEQLKLCHASGQAGEGLSATPPHTHKEGVASRLLQHTTDLGQVLQHVPDGEGVHTANRHLTTRLQYPQSHVHTSHTHHTHITHMHAHMHTCTYISL